MVLNKRFKNGIKLLVIPTKGTEAVSVLVLVRVGSRYEKQSSSGASHFIEHMFFKGTKKRPDNLSIARVLDGVGAEYNAFTAKDHTGYWIKVDKNKLAIALDVLSDIIFNSVFEKKSFEKERGVIMEEIKMYEDNPSMHIDDLFEQNIYRATSLGRKISGETKNIKKIKREGLIKFRDIYYQTKNLEIILAGQVNKKTIDLVKKYFSDHQVSPKRKLEGFKKVKLQNLPPKQRINIVYRDVKQAQLIIGFPAYSYFHKSINALGILGIILGGNMSSRLFSEVRVKRGLAYYIKAGSDIYEDIGFFSIKSGLDKERIFEAISVILEELKKMALKGPNDDELKRSKDYLSGQLKLSMEDSSTVAMWYGHHDLLERKIISPDQKLKIVEKVSKKEVWQVAQDIFKSDKLYLSLIGPFKKIEPFLSVLRKCDMIKR